MTIYKITEAVGSSTIGWEEACQEIINRANKTLAGISGFEVTSMKAKVKDNKISEYRVTIRFTFEMAPDFAIHM